MPKKKILLSHSSKSINFQGFTKRSWQKGVSVGCTLKGVTHCAEFGITRKYQTGLKQLVKYQCSSLCVCWASAKEKSFLSYKSKSINFWGFYLKVLMEGCICRVHLEGCDPLCRFQDYCKNRTRLKQLVKDKHSSLFVWRASAEEKKFFYRIHPSRLTFGVFT